MVRGYAERDPSRADEGAPTMQREPVLELLRSVNEVMRLRKELASMAAGHESFAELALLAMLERNGEARVSQIACLMHVDISVTSRQLARLEEQGFVERTPDPDDRRAHLVRVSQAGAEVMERWRGRILEHFERALEGWTDDEIEDVAAQLQRLREAMDRVGPPAPPAPSADSSNLIGK